MTNTSPEKEKELQDDIKQIVLARLRAMPEDSAISIGMDGDFNKHSLIEHVEKNDELGKKITDIQMNYLQSMKSITEQILSENE